MIPDSPYANLVRLGRYKEASDWRTALEKLKKDKPDLWNIFLDREGKRYVHKNTSYFPVIWNEQSSSLYGYFEHLLEPLAKRFISYYGEGFFRKFLITKQLPKSIIFPHVDINPLFFNTHRCHIPLYTGNTYDYGSVLLNIGYIDEDDHTRFKTDITKRWIAETVPMCADEIWEINNSPNDKYLKHSVMNHSEDVHKIHMIIDWRPDNFVSSFDKKPLDRDRETIE